LFEAGHYINILAASEGVLSKKNVLDVYTQIFSTPKILNTGGIGQIKTQMHGLFTLVETQQELVVASIIPPPAWIMKYGFLC
jgi:hypothetical protein